MCRADGDHRRGRRTTVLRRCAPTVWRKGRRKTGFG